jgi:DNA-binding transcriptional LysR family regulator
MPWDERIGRRLKLRDLHVLRAAARLGSLGKAANELAISQPAVSKAITDLEGLLGVRLLERSPRGVEPTIYGQVLLNRSIAVFDELKQSVSDIDSLGDPTTGEIRIACPLAIASTLIPPAIESFVAKHPRAVLHFDEVTAASMTRNFHELRERQYDFILERWSPLVEDHSTRDDISIEFLFNDPLVIVAGPKSRWAGRRRKVDLAELLDEPWIMQGPHTWNYRTLAEACRSHNLPIPTASVVTLSISVITHFLANGPFVTSMPRSVAYFKSLKVLPVDLPARPWSVNIARLNNRTLRPVVERFIDHLRDFTKPMRESTPSWRRYSDQR